MANGTTNGNQTRTALVQAAAQRNLDSISLKGKLAFFLVIISALMVFLWMLKPPSGDPGLVALLAGFVTLFIKMAADACGYQYNSSAGSDKKDEATGNVVDKLTGAPSPPGPGGPVAPVPQPVVVVPWWTALTDPEKAAITAAAPADTKVMAFVTAANVGKATPADLSHLVASGLLTQARADEIGKL